MISLSVIVPTYNSEDTLESCLTSLSRQVFKDFEVLIIDGGSTDNTIKVANKFSSLLQLQIFSEEDSGIYDAMNKGILLSSGCWVYFLGSDDEVFSANVFAKIFEPNLVLKNDVIYGNVISTRFNGIYDGEFNPDKIFRKNICHQSIFLRKSVFNKTGLFNTRNEVYADWENNMTWFYDRTINSTYVNVLVARYADGGFSSRYSDSSFFRVKRKIAFTKGFFRISFCLKIKILMMSIRRVIAI